MLRAVLLTASRNNGVRRLVETAPVSRDVVRRFVDADPYVLNGLVRSWEIRRWNVVVGAAT